MADKTFTAPSFEEMDWDGIKTYIDSSTNGSEIKEAVGSIKLEASNGRNLVYDNTISSSQSINAGLTKEEIMFQTARAIFPQGNYMNYHLTNNNKLISVINPVIVELSITSLTYELK